MCGRYTVFTEDEVIEIRSIIAEVSRKFGDGAVCTGEIFPTNNAPILALNNNQLAPIPASWGFPRWDGKGVDINARTETVLYALDHPEKRSIWRKPILTRRCVIPSTGFYEWAFISVFEPQLSLFHVDHNPNAKEPKVKLHFRRPGEHMLYMAGMVDTFADKNGKVKDVFTILTTVNIASLIAHHKIPVALSRFHFACRLVSKHASGVIVHPAFNTLYI